VRTYRIGLGFNPKGHKHKEGDGRTPEGSYYICCKNPNSRYYLSLGLSYPNEQDAAKGLQDGRITGTQCRRIKNAIRRKATPPWNTPLGGEIFIHGRGSHRDWTLGCIALDDGDMRELFGAVPVGTPVTILP
jgi:murein L,D-transpeptidase YafK